MQEQPRVPDLPAKDVAINDLGVASRAINGVSYPSYYPVGSSVLMPSYPYNYRGGLGELGITGRIESTTRPVLSSIENLLQAMYSCTTLIDSAYVTFFSLSTLVAGFLKKVNVHSWISELWLSNTLAPKKHSLRGKITASLVALIMALGIYKFSKFIVSTFISTAAKISGVPEASQMASLQTPIFGKVDFEFKGEREDELTMGKDTLLAILKVPYDVAPKGQVSVLEFNKYVIEKLQQDPRWILCRTKDARVGLFPSNYLTILEPSTSMKL